MRRRIVTGLSGISVAEQLSKCHTMCCVFARQVCQELARWGDKSAIPGAMQCSGLRGKISGLKWGSCWTLCFPGAGCFSQGCLCHPEAVTNVIRSLMVHELNSCLLFDQLLPLDTSLDVLSSAAVDPMNAETVHLDTAGEIYPWAKANINLRLTPFFGISVGLCRASSRLLGNAGPEIIMKKLLLARKQS